jgi:DMSO/TMAO reductase YedYZ molybdopterin-dependent catalytic subunit
MSNCGFSRRALLGGAVVCAGGLLSGCDRLNENAAFRSLLRSAEAGNLAVQRALGDRAQLAREYPDSARSPTFRANGTKQPDSPSYRAMQANGFAGWRLQIMGLVERAQDFTIPALRSMPQRRQTTRHDCVEGWSAIGTWTGVPLALLLNQCGVRPAARYVIFECADRLGSADYYESIDLIDAYHPQTIIAHALNDEPLPVENGAPLRLRVERQLGYKHAKYVHRIRLVDQLDNFAGGKGGYWEDQADYEWYAGI